MTRLQVNPPRTEKLIAALVALWQANVAVTHTFVTPSDLKAIAATVPPALHAIDILVVAYDGTEPVGFLGVAAQQIEMLFVKVTKRQQGIGTQLLQKAVADLGAQTVTVNEQNTAAHRFYTTHGFSFLARSAVDDNGRPYPILTLQYQP